MPTSPYATPGDPAKRNSAALTDGPDRAPARAMLKGTGFSEEDVARPIVGVATNWLAPRSRGGHPGRRTARGRSRLSSASMPLGGTE
jgi:dihydroxyacid dehydratase/phosphogluconate dehydratase